MKHPETGKDRAYRQITEALRRRRGGASPADITAATALPLSTVQELLPRAADEYNGRLQVTESGEILYSFPRGFTSRYRGPGAVLKRGLEKAAAFTAAALSLFFKLWIMVMLVGYFVLFMIIALASFFIAAAARTSNSNDRRRTHGGGFYFGSVFDLIIRIWFYSELTRGRSGAYGRYDRSGGGPRPKQAPLYKRIFAFVFGEEDPNRDWAPREKKAVIAHIQANSGVIALPEFMAFTGLSPEKAAGEMLAFCCEFGGSPEAGPDGTVVYRFDELLKRKDAENAARGQPEISAPVKPLRVFSANSKSMNTWFALINGVNLVFGGYFLYNAVVSGPVLTQTSSYVYALVVTVLLNHVTANPWPVIAAGLGAVPLVFSALFWLIPALRFAVMKRENREIQTGNLRRLGFLHIWTHPTGVRGIDSSAAECRPPRMDAACGRIIRDMGAYSMPDVEIDDRGETVYNFNALKAEKEALQRYRSGIKTGSLGKTVFDTD
ncbi:MAG: hypothetical protein LBD71_03635 [Treponema sp.]|jgi:hypothetical protein|nr:hypothetical protein [Treponema sp.]